MSITPTDMMIDPRRAGPPLRLTPDAGPQAGIIERGGRVEATQATATAGGEAADEDYSFWDLLDVINPLQHIPVVSTIYRELTGDEIRAPAKLAGGALFGGVIGLAASAMDVILKEVSGRDAGEHVVALFDGAPDDADPNAAVLLAENAADAAPVSTDPAPAPVPAAVAASASAPAVVGAEGTRWFSINRDQHVRVGAAAPEPVREAMLRAGGGPTVEVTSPRPEASPATSLPLGVMSAASAAAAPKDGTPPPDAVRRALAAQGLQPRDDHAMLRAAVPLAPVANVAVPVSIPSAVRTQAAAPSSTSASQANASPAGGPVDVPAWFDRAMRKYGASDSLAPDGHIPAAGPVAAPVDRRGV